MALPLLMALSGIAQGVGSILGGRAQARAGRANYRAAKREAADVIARGEEEAERYQMDLSGLLGTQRTNIAASGIDVNQGSAAQIKAQTERYGAEDIETIKLNATRAAWGIMSQAKIDRRLSNAQAVSGVLQGVGTLLGVAGQSKAWDSYRARRSATGAIGRDIAAWG